MAKTVFLTPYRGGSVMAFRLLIIIGVLFFSAGPALAEHRGGDYDRDNRYETDDYYGREKDYHYERERRDERRLKHAEKRFKEERKADRKHHKLHRKLEKKHWKFNKKAGEHRKRYYERYNKHRHHVELPEWAHHCGLPPGLARRHKIPHGWEERCRSGQKYYDYREEFRQDVYSDQRVIYRNQPSYQTVYEMDASECKVSAIRSAGHVAERVAIGAVFGAIIGAAGGAIIESTRRGGDAGRGAATGAVGGAVGGAVLGGILASNDYKRDFRRCMEQRGHWRY